jgi:hypothetical protein
MSFDGGIYMVDDVNVLWVRKVRDAEDLFNAGSALFRQARLVSALVEKVVAIVLVGFRA